MDAFLWTFYIGLYQLPALPWHLIPVLLGFAIRSSMETRLSQRIWLGTLILMTIGCAFAWAQIGGFDRGFVCFACAAVIDLAVGTAIIGIPKLICQVAEFFKQWNT